MKHATVVAVVLGAGILLRIGNSGLVAENLPAEYQPCIRKGLEWLVQQQRPDGRWTSNGRFPVAMTALCGMSLLMEGSTLREGQYADSLRRAVHWLAERTRANGMLGNPEIPVGGGPYMYGHGFALLFLACVYGEEQDGELRRRLEDILTRAVQFTCRAQCKNGGWGYVSSADSQGFDEGSVTVTQMQALRAARNAGIVAPKEIIDHGIDYLRKCTTLQGGVKYQPGFQGEASHALTPAAVVCGFSAGEYGSGLVKQWIDFCRQKLPRGEVGRIGHDEYTHLYLAQLVYNLGDDGYARLFPDSPPAERLTWSTYRKATFGRLTRCQGADGSWKGDYIGPVYTTALSLIVLQLDNAALPIYQR